MACQMNKWRWLQNLRGVGQDASKGVATAVRRVPVSSHTLLLSRCYSRLLISLEYIEININSTATAELRDGVFTFAEYIFQHQFVTGYPICRSGQQQQ